MINNTQTGVGLIEVLVSMVIIAVGVLGLLGMQTKALQQSQETHSFSQSSVMAKQLFERMRANHSYVVNGSTASQCGTSSSKNSANLYENDFTDTLPPTSSLNCKSNYCSAAQMAKWDILDWSQYRPDEMEGWRVRVRVENTDIGSIKSAKICLSIQIPSRRESTAYTDSAGNYYEQFNFQTRL